MAQDQQDIIQENERLTARVSELEAQLAQANQGRISESNLLTAANAKVGELTGQLSEANRVVTDLKAKDMDVDRRAAAQLAQIGIVRGSKPEKQEKPATEKVNWTQRALDAKKAAA